MKILKNFALFFMTIIISFETIGVELVNSTKKQNNIKEDNQVTKTYSPRPDLTGKQTGSLELSYQFDIKATGEYEPELGLPLYDIYKRTNTADGKTLFYEKEYSGDIKPRPPKNHHKKEIIKFIKNGEERWITIDHYYETTGTPSYIKQYRLWDDINNEIKVAFDKGKVERLYIDTDKFNEILGIFSDVNYISYTNGKPTQKHYITVQNGVKEDLYENYDEQGTLESVNYLKNTNFIYTKYFYPNGKIKSYVNHHKNIEQDFNENGILIKKLSK